MSSSKVKFRIENGAKSITLLYTSVKINVITWEVIENTRLAIQCNPKLELISCKNHSHPFHNLSKDVKIDIKGLKIKQLIFIVEYGDYNLVLD